MTGSQVPQDGRTGRPALALIGLLVLIAGRAEAAERSVVRYADLDLASARGARLMFARIDQAALDICGGGRASLREINLAVRRTGCWREAVEAAVASLDAPRVTEAWRHALGRSAPAAGPRAAAPAPQR